MIRAIGLLLGLLLLSLPAASQQVPNPMSNDAANAKLPGARNNLELGTVKSEGGPTGVVTSFYDDYGVLQHQIGSQPNAAEYAFEQAGITGQGATRVCRGAAGTTVLCNYIASGVAGKHIFGAGSGTLADIGLSGTSATHAWPRLLATDGQVARLEAHADSFPDIDLELKAQGHGQVRILNGDATLAKFVHPVPGAPDGVFTFTGPTFGGPSTIAAEPNGIEFFGQRLPMRPTAGNYSIPTSESGMQYHNTGASASVTYTLPAAIQGLQYCFSVHAAFAVIVKASGTDRIAIGASNSAAGGQVSANQPFASLCITAPLSNGQWITRSTADKTQWTVT